MDLARLTGVLRSLAIYRLRPGRVRRMARFYGQFVARGELAIDVGAHVGDRVAAFRSLGARVVAVEPQPHLARLLRLLNRLDRKVTVLDCALGAAEGEATLRVNRANPTLSTLSPDWAGTVAASPRFPGERWDEGVAVRVSSLDALIRAHGVPSFIKVDVEGFEAEVLAGLTYAVPALSFEYLPETPRAAVDCVWRLAALAPYRFNACRGEGFTWEHRFWLGPTEMATWLARRPLEDGGGDVYAALRVPGKR